MTTYQAARERVSTSCPRPSRGQHNPARIFRARGEWGSFKCSVRGILHANTQFLQLHNLPFKPANTIVHYSHPTQHSLSHLARRQFVSECPAPPSPPHPAPLLCHVFTNKTLSQSSHLHSAPGSHTATLDTLDNMDTLDPADTLDNMDTLDPADTL